MKYEAPEMKVIEISADVIRTSGITGGGNSDSVGGGGTLED